MQLDRLALHLRRRGPWEAIDLGFAMARTWWRPIMAAWLPVYTSAALLLTFLCHGSPLLAVALLWWLKPVFDRVVLEVLSRAVFGEVPRAAEALRALPRSPGLLASLTLYRFDLARAFNLPIWHLERLSGGAARQRGRSLQRRTRSYAVWLTIACVHLELVLALAFFGAADLFTPAQYESAFGLQSLFGSDAPLWRQWLDCAVYAISVTLIEPFYVAAGFALYLNRRTQLEAWDVELALRRFAKRPFARAAAAATLSAALTIAASVPVADAAEREAQAPETAIREILSQPEFERYRERSRFRYTGRRGESAEPSAASEPRVPGFAGWIAEIGRVIMWLGVIALVVAAIYLARTYASVWGPERGAREPPPSVLFGFDISPESLPSDVAAAALGAAEAGRVREALSLLYRGALSALVNHDGVDFVPGDTEGDCVRLAAARVEPSKAEFFRTLVAAWQSVAYAGRLPHPDAVRALCGGWRDTFGERAAP